MNDFEILKLNRAIWIALFKQGNFIDAVNTFESYMYEVKNFCQKFSPYQKEAQKEMALSIEIYLSNLYEFAEVFEKNNDYYNLLLCCTNYFRYKQDSIEIIKKFALCFEYTAQADLEIDILLLLKHLDLKIPEYYKSLASAYQRNKDYETALKYYEQYLELKGEQNLTPGDYNDYGFALSKTYDVTFCKETALKALDCLMKASDLQPNNKVFAKNAMFAARDLKNFKMEKKYWDRMFEIGDITNDEKFMYSVFSWNTQNFEDWHKYFNTRFVTQKAPIPLPKTSKPEYDGNQDLSEKTLLVHREQGLGDTFFIFGYMPKIVKLAKHVIFLVNDCQYDLLKNNSFGVEIVKESDVQNLDNDINFDYWISSMSIPIILKLTKENLSVGSSYIKADENLVAQYAKKYFRNKNLKIGLSIHGNLISKMNRDIKIEELLPLDKLRGVSFYLLNKDVSKEELKKFKRNKIINLGETFETFSHTAAAIENCDLVISTDNVILNLCGALGKKTFGLFNFLPEYRWFDLTGEDVIYYSSVKPFQSPLQNDWTQTVKNVFEEIVKIQKKL